MAFSPLNDRYAEQQRHKENRGRLAHTYSRVSTVGAGTYEFEDSINFGLTFIERPFIAIGHQIDVDQTALDGFDPVGLPVCTGYVTHWDTTDRDHYVGCWIAVTVTLPAPLVGTEAVKVFHDFTWSAIAIKDIPTDLAGE